MADEAEKTEELLPPQLVNTLQAVLLAESRFLFRLRERTAEMCKVKEDVVAIQRELNHENVVHVARFFFLLKALDCSSPAAIEALIEAHNLKVKRLLDAEDFRFRTRKELQKSVFKDAQQYVCVKTVKEKGRAVLAKTEIAALLFDHMSRDSAVKTIDLLVRAGLLIEEDSDPLSGSNRKLIKTDGILEDTVASYLSDIGNLAIKLNGGKS
ncbi:hypothetical protein Q5Y75_24465 [Ruegeria sp. 2205SS24-7]|uniref:hypothetical protein n=1 Tax=Ruegeria discodermiae TaxID=3064389 RepID=UPI00274266FB|nr:hypothetical protein [Ruegeria sp. 2205SS24-7]MDP5220349.1 hypothetical protein [Ruegeria sp. 2205SS24-7]